MENYLDDISYENYPAFYKDNEGSSVICKPEFLYSLISEIMSTVDDLNLDQLKVLRQRIDDIILNKTQQNHIEEIKNQVSLKGYYCDPEFTKNIPGLKYMSLPLYINIYTHNKEDFSDCHVSGLKDEQLPWVHKLGFDYEPNDDDDYVCPDFEWESGDWDDPLTNESTINIYVYYELTPCPTEGSTFEGINEFGEIEQVVIHHNEIIVDGKFLADVSEWDQLEMLVLKN